MDSARPLSEDQAGQGHNAANAAFVRELHRALSRLYSPPELARVRLIELMGLARSPDPAAALQHTLLQAIEAMKPSSQVPPQANAWRIYHILNQRYAGQFAPEDVATNLAISGRQLRRLQVVALQALGDRLWARSGLGQRSSTPPAPHEPERQGGYGLGSGPPTREQELEQLKTFTADEPVSAAEAIHAAISVAGPLIAASRARIDLQLAGDLPQLAVRAIAVRHVLLSVFTAAIRTAAGGTIRITAGTHADQVWIEVDPFIAGPAGPAGPPPPASSQSENVAMARQLAELCGGSLELIAGSDRAAPSRGRLILPSAEQATVLVIDDNADTLRLFERYLAGTRFRFVGVADPLQALAAAEGVRPHLIVLDLMLPGIDGWEILGRLREHPKIRGTPIIVCSILPHEDLALALGAAALIRKPVSQEAFLAALGHQLARPRQES